MFFIYSLPSDFDPDTYLELNSDIAKTHIGARWHFRLFGRKQGRPYKRSSDPNDRFAVPLDFESDEYLVMNEDVATAGVCPALHYVQHGRTEGRFINLDAALNSGVVVTALQDALLDSLDRREEGLSTPAFELDSMVELPLDQLLRHFESIGDNCEFGLFQRACAVESIGLLRFNFCKHAELMKGLENRFGDILFDDIRIVVEHVFNEYIVSIPIYKMSYHTFRYVGSVDPEVLREQEFKRIRYMVDKFFEDLSDAEKIFVRKEHEGVSQDEIIALFQQLRRFGAITLLWVVPDDPGHPSGTVEVIQQGLLKGYIDRFAPGDVAADISFPTWGQICRGAYKLWMENAPVGSTRRCPASAASSANLLPDRLDTDSWNTFGGVSRTRGGGAQPTVAMAIVAHKIEAETCRAYIIHEIKSILSPGSIYVFSMFVFIPHQSNVTRVQLEFIGGNLAATWFSSALLPYRNFWQRIWISVKADERIDKVALSLNISGDPASIVYSTGHRLDLGIVPAYYRPLKPGARPLQPTEERYCKSSNQS